MGERATVASTEFQNRAGLYIEKAAREPVFITRHKRPVRVLLDITEYERLMANDTRRAYLIEELPGDLVQALHDVDLSHLDPKLDQLLESGRDEATA